MRDFSLSIEPEGVGEWKRFFDEYEANYQRNSYMKESYFFGILPTKKDPPLLLPPSKTISYVYLSLLLVNFHIKKENSPLRYKIWYAFVWIPTHRRRMLCFGRKSRFLIVTEYTLTILLKVNNSIEKLLLLPPFFHWYKRPQQEWIKKERNVPS